MVTLAHDLVVAQQVDAVFFRPLLVHLEALVGARLDLLRMNQVLAYDNAVVRLGVGRLVMHQPHLLAGDVEQLVVLGVQWADVEEAVLGELAERNQPLAVGLLGLAHARVGVPDLVVDIDLLDDRIDLLFTLRLLVGLDRLVDVPLGDDRIDEDRRIGVAAPVKGRVQRP